MGVSDAPNDEILRVAAPAGAAALVAIAAVVGLSLAVTSGNPTVATGGQEIVAEPAVPPPAGSGMPGVAQNQQGARGAPELGVEIVVKFKDDAMVKDITDLFWRDQSGAQSKFASFKRKYAALGGVRLARVTYSNELVLVSTSSASPSEAAPAMRELAKRISEMPEVSYAEPNATAHPGDQ